MGREGENRSREWLGGEKDGVYQEVVKNIYIYSKMKGNSKMKGKNRKKMQKQLNGNNS